MPIAELLRPSHEAQKDPKAAHNARVGNDHRVESGAPHVEEAIEAWFGPPDADFSPVALLEATPAEAEGVAAMMKVMQVAGVDVAFGTRLEAVAREQGAHVEYVESAEGVARRPVGADRPDRSALATA